MNNTQLYQALNALRDTLIQTKVQLNNSLAQLDYIIKQVQKGIK